MFPIYFAVAQCPHGRLDPELRTLRFPPVHSLAVKLESSFSFCSVFFFNFFFSCQVNPLFDAAWKAINSLDIHDVEEIRSYRTPPAIVRLVVDAVCLLFEKEQT